MIYKVIKWDKDTLQANTEKGILTIRNTKYIVVSVAEETIDAKIVLEVKNSKMKFAIVNSNQYPKSIVPVEK